MIMSLTIEDLIELSWGSMGHKVSRYADLWKQKEYQSLQINLQQQKLTKPFHYLVCNVISGCALHAAIDA